MRFDAKCFTWAGAFVGPAFSLQVLAMDDVQ